MTPATMKSAPLVYTGADVSRLAKIAMIGAMMPNIRFEVAASALPVPRSLVGKISGVNPYRTAYYTGGTQRSVKAVLNIETDVTRTITVDVKP
jgi:hypothetical protein